MSPVFLNYFICVQVLVMVAFAFSFLIRWSAQQFVNLRVSAVDELRANYFMLLLVLALPFLFSFSSSGDLKFEPFIKSYSATGLSSATTAKNAGDEIVPIVIGRYKTSVSMQRAESIIIFFVLGSLIFSLLQIVKEWRAIRSVIADSFLIRSIGRVKITASDSISVPFSIIFGKTAWVVLPTTILDNMQLIRMSVLHELQHHRQKDTQLVYLHAVLKGLFILNPAYHLWMKIISELQELKVDETLVHRNKVKPQEYARCLTTIAEHVVQGFGTKLVCATGFSFVTDRQILIRRIQTMFTKRTTQRRVIVPLMLLGVLSLSAATVTMGQSIGSRTLTQAQALKLVEDVNKDSDFPVTLNASVLEQLNKYVGTEQGRNFMKQALARMNDHKDTVTRNLKEYAIPEELAAIPLVESGYQNFPAARNPYGAAGIWQFIEGTASNYGLIIGSVVDERMNIEKATDAAMRLLLANRVRFKNWPLSILAYNAGEKVVSKGVLKMRSYDAWTLIQNGFEGDKKYLAKVMASVIIMKKPELLN